MPTDVQNFSTSDDLLNLDKKTVTSIKETCSINCNNANKKKQSCCSPLGCQEDDVLGNVINSVSPNVEDEIVRLICSNDECAQSGWMHGTCFEIWQENILTYLKTCGKARSWSDKQRQQYLWTKKGYSLVYNMCTCLCSNGHLRKIVETFPKPPENLVQQVQSQLVMSIVQGRTNGRSRRRSGRRRTGATNYTDKTLVTSVPVNGYGQRVSVNSSSSAVDCVTNGANRAHRRSRNISNSSTFSSSPGTAGSPVSPGVLDLPGGLDALGIGARGNIFAQRSDFSVFSSLPASMRNLYQIVTEDESSSANDDSKQLVLTTLTYFAARRLPCLLCRAQLTVYDHLPLIDGTFFLSPVLHSENAGFAVRRTNQQQQQAQNNSSGCGTIFLHALCMHCLAGVSGTVVRCRFCSQLWSGKNLVIGGLYTFDVLSSSLCCDNRLRCSKCSAIASQHHLPTFAQYSQKHVCSQCKTEDYHCIKRLSDVFCVEQIPTQSQRQTQLLGRTPPNPLGAAAAPGSPINLSTKQQQQQAYQPFRNRYCATACHSTAPISSSSQSVTSDGLG